MACPHFNIRIIQRSKGQSAIAAAAYQSGERLHSDYDQSFIGNLPQASGQSSEIRAGV